MLSPHQAMQAIRYMHTDELLALARRIAELGDWPLALTVYDFAQCQGEPLLATCHHEWPSLDQQEVH